jgi:serine/threonine protein kinase/tetratricopeptide (TPR) repeat protein
MQLAPGARLGPYEILSPLGQGGMGEVYRARDPRLGREVAIKVLPADVANHPDRLSRFEREAKAVAALNHPNLVTLHSIEEANGVRFLTMELVDGQSLDQLVVPGGLPLARALDLSIAITEALIAAHQKGVVHRDLKPANVMVSRDGRVKVLDFGLAKLHEPEAVGASMVPTMDQPISAVGLVLGTLPYMSPEQLRGAAVDARSDVFSLGVLIYELVTGKRPFGGATSVEVSSAILRDPPPPVSTGRANVPGDLDRILSRCLEKDPERRTQTAKDVRNELEMLRRAAPTAPPAKPAPVAAPSADLPSVAVLPFVNRSADPADEYFSDGLADELLSVLVKIRGLRVAARTSSNMFKGKQVSISEAGRALHVATVLEGSVRKAGNRVRISVQLVKVEDEYPLWSETYDRTLDDIFAVQDDIAQSVVKELRTTLLGETPDSEASGEAKAEVARAAEGRGRNPEAHRLYLQGVYFVERFTGEGAAKGIEHLRQAVALDPTHALAWTALGRAYAFQAAYGWIDVEEGGRLARQAITKALALAPDLAEAHLVLAQLQAFHEYDWKSANQSCARALELEPGNAFVLAGVAQVKSLQGGFDEAEQLFLRAVEQDPLSARAYGQLGSLYRWAGRVPEAERAYRKSLEISPQRITAHFLLSEMISGRGEYDAAEAEAKLEPADWARLTALTSVYFRSGRRAESDRALAELEAKHSKDSAFQIAAMYAERGDPDKAFHWLERALAQHDQGAVVTMCEPLFRSLHGDPRWIPFLKKIGLAD